MIVRFRQGNVVSGLKELRRATKTGLASHLRDGDDYLVYGIILDSNEVCYLICPEHEDEYPRRYLSGFFEVLDPRVPPGWMGNVGRKTNFGEKAILPKFFYDDPYRLEKLVDGDTSSLRQFFALKAALESWHAPQERSDSAIDAILNDDPIRAPEPSEFQATFGAEYNRDPDSGVRLDLVDFEDTRATLAWSDARDFLVTVQNDNNLLFEGSFFGLTSIGIEDDSITAKVLGPVGTPSIATVRIQVFPTLSTHVRWD